MKRIVLTTAIVLGFAAPALAQSQLERSLGVDAGVYTTAQLAQLAGAQTDQGIEGKVFFGGTDGHSARAAEIFAAIAAEDAGDGSHLGGVVFTNGTVSSMSGHNAVAQKIFAEIAASENGAEK